MLSSCYRNKSISIPTRAQDGCDEDKKENSKFDTHKKYSDIFCTSDTFHPAYVPKIKKIQTHNLLIRPKILIT